MNKKELKIIYKQIYDRTLTFEGFIEWMDDLEIEQLSPTKKKNK